MRRGVHQVISAKDEAWWPKVCAAAPHEASAAEDLPADGMVWSYPTLSFLEWANKITWQHEWKKYFVIDFGGPTPVHAPTPKRPNSRTSF